ncbi:MAG: outer membrane protein assembly factor BamE [Burkholderiales bacterium]
MKRIAVCAAALAAFAGGCASFDGRGLAPGKSTAAEVEALMGAPAERLSLPNGDRALYFSRLPAGRAMFAVTIGQDGVMKSIEQRLARWNIAQIRAGAWTRKEVRELLGPPGLSGRLALLPREWWEYKFRDDQDYQYRVLWVQFSDDGVVREVLDMLDPEFARPGGAR